MSLSYPQIDPVALDLGPVQIHWYGLMYLFGFVAAYLLGQHRAQRMGSPIAKEQVGDMIYYCALGVIIGGRLGYVFFYNFDKFLDDPIWLFKVWEGGMAFHGGLMGVMLAIVFYARKLGCTFFQLLDFLAPLVPIGLGLGRIGNFIGAELWGRATDAPWGMVFPNDPEGLVRHPSQLYQFALEGVLFFIILWFYSSKPRPAASVSGMFMIFYGIFRFLVEFVRQPDAHIGFIAWGWLTKGQLLSFPMILIGIGFIWYAYRFNRLDGDKAVKGKPV
jgi:phosphatidylglycerol---prolipoprotein diacylglyceryl transferase